MFPTKGQTRQEFHHAPPKTCLLKEHLLLLPTTPLTVLSDI